MYAAPSHDLPRSRIEREILWSLRTAVVRREPLRSAVFAIKVPPMRTCFLAGALVVGALIAQVGCDRASPQPPAEATTSTAATAAATATASATSGATALRAAKPKDTNATAAQALGTLPDGVGIAVGEVAPDFELPAVEGGKVSLSALLKKGEVLLVFYRGGW